MFSRAIHFIKWGMSYSPRLKWPERDFDHSALLGPIICMTMAVSLLLLFSFVEYRYTATNVFTKLSLSNPGTLRASLNGTQPNKNDYSVFL